MGSVLKLIVNTILMIVTSLAISSNAASSTQKRSQESPKITNLSAPNVNHTHPYLGQWQWVQSNPDRPSGCQNLKLEFALGKLNTDDGFIKQTYQYTAERLKNKSDGIGFNLIMDLESRQGERDCKGRKMKSELTEAGLGFAFIELSEALDGLKFYHAHGQVDWFRRIEE